MIVQTKTGVQVSGTIAKDPEIKVLGGKDVLILTVKAHSEKDEAGNWKSLFVDVQCWRGIDKRSGMYQKGDFITAEGRELKSREYPPGSGKWYYNLPADGITPDDLISIRWMQQIVDMIPPAPAPCPADFTPVDAPPPEQFTADPQLAGHELYPGEQLSAYSPEVRAAAQSPAPAAAPAAEMEPPIEEAEDLPF